LANFAAMNQGLSKDERLKSRKQITKLFSKNSNVFSYPFKFIFQEHDFDSNFPVQLLISVSKRTFKHAVDRNHMKRLIRESYRKNKLMIYTPLQDNDSKIFLGIIFVGKDIMDQEKIELGIKKGFKKLANEIQKKAN